MTGFLAAYADILTAVFLVAGVFFHLVAGLGILRLPDVYMRISGTGMAGTLGTSCLILAAAVHFANIPALCRALVIIFFVFITAPISGHILARGAYLFGVPLWSKSVADAWKPVLEQEARRAPENGPERAEESGAPEA